MVQSTTLFLTDLLASCFLVISLIYLLSSDLNTWRNGAAISFFLYSSVLIRPSNAIFMILFALIAIYRFIKVKDYKPYKFIAIGLICLILFLPQVYMNITKFNHLTPLIHSNLYERQIVGAAHYLKYGTVVISEEDPRLFSYAPIQAVGDTNIYDMITINPLNFVFLIGAHIFGILDWGYVSTYIKDFSVSYRVAPSIMLYFAWIVSIVGLVYSRIRKNLRLIWVGTLTATIGYSLLMSTTVVESRFGYPLYLMMLFFSGYGVEYFIQIYKDRKNIVIWSLTLLM